MTGIGRILGKKKKNQSLKTIETALEMYLGPLEAKCHQLFFQKYDV